MVAVQVARSGEGWACDVTIDQGATQTRHAVRVSRADAERWARGTSDDDVEDLVRRSFDFLLAREPATSILRAFDLPAIERYFPDYGEAISQSG